MAFSEPKKTIMGLGISEGMFVADIGAGSGHFTLEMAKRVGAGKVYAIDIQKNLLARIKNQADKEKLTSVEIIWSDADKVHGTTLRDNSVHRVLLSNILFQLENKEIIVDEIKRILKPEGKVLVIDWAGSFGGLGPSESSIVTCARAKDLFEKAGFFFEGESPVGEHHYGILFKQ